VIVQIVGIVVLCATAFPVCTWPVLISIQVLSGILLIWTWFFLVPGKFHIMPDHIKSDKLITGGPFRWIRHPMYLSLMLFLVPLVIEYYNWWRLLVLIIFVVNMVIKMFFEEKALQLRFPDYASYMQHSKRVIPFIF
jgi:protein-S-isoprenylcysteine O-methyltransferase Ste14